MHCDQCGKENRKDSKFCRYCGSPLSSTKSHKKNNKTNPKKILITLGIIVIIFGLLFGGYKAYGYYLVESKITTSQNLQSTSNFNGSISTLSDLGGYSPTIAQENRINAIKTADQKFISFQNSLDLAITLETTPITATTSTSTNLQAALSDLQSIDPSYPAYKDVQSEIVKLQNLLVTSLQNDANASKAAAVSAKAQAVAATAAKAQAEESAEKAQSEADSAATNAQAQANEAQTATAEQSFVNQLTTIQNSFISDCIENATQGMKDDNIGDDSNGTYYIGAASTACLATEKNAKALNNSFTNMPSTYIDAANDMEWAAYYVNEGIGAYLDSDTSTAVTDTDDSGNYDDSVISFLANPQ